LIKEGKSRSLEFGTKFQRYSGKAAIDVHLPRSLGCIAAVHGQVPPAARAATVQHGVAPDARSRGRSGESFHKGSVAPDRSRVLAVPTGRAGWGDASQVGCASGAAGRKPEAVVTSGGACALQARGGSERWYPAAEFA
jgi:hypothetical protein